MFSIACTGNDLGNNFWQDWPTDLYVTNLITEPTSASRIPPSQSPKTPQQPAAQVTFSFVSDALNFLLDCQLVETGKGKTQK
jgi:hypothetical protein